MTKLSHDEPRVEAVLGHYGDNRIGTVAIERGEGNVSIRLAPDRVYELEFYDDNGELVGMFGRFSEVRFLPPYSDKPGALFKINRREGRGPIWDIWDYNSASDEAPGPNKSDWSRYVGDYEVFNDGVPYRFTASVAVKNGYLYYNDLKCTEHEPGLFLSYDGEALDFRSEPPSFANIALRKK